MRRHLPVALLLLGLLPGGRAVADDSVFDFVAPRADQPGAYAAAGGGVVVGGVATIAPRSGWLGEGWALRRHIVVTGVASALVEWPLRLAFDAADTAAADVLGRARPTGADLRVTIGVTSMPATFGPWTPAENRGDLWFRAANVPVGVSTAYLYYENPAAPAAASLFGAFSTTAPAATRYLVEPEGSELRIAALADGTTWSLGALGGTLDAGDVAVVAAGTWTMGQAVAATKPIDVGFAADATGEGVPAGFAATAFELPVSRGAETRIYLLCPWAATTVAVSLNGTATATVDLTAGAVGTYVAVLAANTVVGLSAPAPFLATHRSSDLLDGVVLVPPSDELWGVRSGTPRVRAVGGAAATVTAYDSTGVATVVNIPAGGTGVLAAGSQGGGDALRLVARDGGGAPVRIAAVSNGDGDGGDEISFHPRAELGRTWVLPTDADYVRVATLGAATTCTLVEPGGTTLSATSSTTIVPPYPGRVALGALDAVVHPAGTLITCDAPGFAVYEDGTLVAAVATGDERNLYPAQAHRPGGAALPSAALGATVEGRYAATTGTVDTPDVVPATAPLAWTGFRDATSAPDGTAIGYLVSVDSGASWLVPLASTWTTAASPDVGVAASAIDDALTTLPTTTGRLRVRVALRSLDGVSRPSVDAVRVFYDAAGAPATLTWDALPTSLVYREATTAGLTVRDASGVRMTGVSGPLALTASHGGKVAPATIDVVAGRADVSLSVDGIADDVTLRAAGLGLVGTSTPFDIIAPAGASVILQSGDDQYATAGEVLAEPIVWSVRDSLGAPIADAQVTVAVIDGGGVFEPAGSANLVALSDSWGEVVVWPRLGAAPGPNRFRAAAVGLSVDAVARGDEAGAEPPPPPPADDGCGCRAGGGGRLPLGAALLLLVTVLWRRAR